MAGVSRQAVSNWFKGDFHSVNLYSHNLEKLAQGLGVSIDDLTQSLPFSSQELESLETRILWDRLYPDLGHFISGVVRGQPDALARLVQVFGFLSAQKIAGKQVRSKFELYKGKIHPAYRKSAEVLWKLTNLT